jgi:hypothetical protein
VTMMDLSWSDFVMAVSPELFVLYLAPPAGRGRMARVSARSG